MKEKYYLIESVQGPYEGDGPMLKVIECDDLHGVAQNMVAHRMHVTDIGHGVRVIRGENISIRVVEHVLAPIREQHERQAREQQAQAGEARERSEYERLKAKFETEREDDSER